MEWFDEFLNDVSGGKKGSIDFKVFKGTDLQIGSHVPYGVPSRIPQLDLAIGRNGYPAGRSVEVFGFEHVGKSCAALSAVAAAQRMGGFGVWIDAERSFQADWAIKNGCDPARVVLAEADCIEGIFTVLERAIDAYSSHETKTPLVCAVDSVTAIPSRESQDKDYGEVQRIGTDARAIRIGMRKINAKIANAKVLVIFVNHSIANMNSPMGGGISAGGHALKFNAGLRIQLARKKTVTDEVEDEKVYRGMEVQITVEKNRVGRTSTRQVSCFLLENGFDLYSNLFDGFQRIGVLEAVNKRTFLFKPTETRISRAEWRTFIDEHSKGVDLAYDWFLKKAIEQGEIVAYGGLVSSPE